eukprot:1158158-Pelagomonas_calceolata.AAC.6
MLHISLQIIFRGMRVRVGIYQGLVDRVAPHARTGRADYFGQPVNRAARLMTAAFGGQPVSRAARLMAAAFGGRVDRVPGGQRLSRDNKVPEDRAAGLMMAAFGGQARAAST